MPFRTYLFSALISLLSFLSFYIFIRGIYYNWAFLIEIKFSEVIAASTRKKMLIFRLINSIFKLQNGFPNFPTMTTQRKLLRLGKIINTLCVLNLLCANTHHGRFVYWYPHKCRVTYRRWYNVLLTRYYDMLVTAYPIHGKGNSLFNKSWCQMIELTSDLTQNYTFSFHILLIFSYSTFASLLYFQILELLILSLALSSPYTFAYAVQSSWNILSYLLKHPHSLANIFTHLSFSHPFIHLIVKHSPAVAHA